jgi:2-methylisocitrate lyase-like PEP mutase family enzyme
MSGKRLKEIVAARDAMIMPGAPNAMFARVIEDLGFAAVYISGAGIANMHLGAPDIGLVTMSEIQNVVASVSDAVSIPIVVDIDTGFGNPLNTIRTVRALERAGASGLQIEDQIFPKRCGHFSGKEVVSIDEIVQKIQAAVDTRIDPNLQIIARTDSRAVLGLDAAIERGQKFVEAGADVIFIEAPLNEDELRRVAKEISAPQLVNIVFGGLTPALSQATFREMGFSIVLYANAALQAALKASNEVLGALKNEGSLDSVRDRLASFEERQRVVEKHKYDTLEILYTNGSGLDRK